MSGVEFVPQPLAPEQAPPEPPTAADEARPEPQPGPRQVRRLWLRSLTSRLVAGVVALVLVLVVAIGTCTYFALRSFLNARLDQQLQTTARGADFLFRGGVPENGPRPTDVWAVALDPTDGSVVYTPTGRGIVALKLSPAVRKAIAARQDPDPVTIRTTDGTQLRVTVRFGAVRFQSDPLDPVPATFIIGLSTGDEHQTLSRLLSLEVLIGGGAVLIAVVATTWGVRRSLRNLYAVTGTAREVAAELSPTGAGLDRRVPVVEEGTEVGQLAESMNTLLAAVETQFGARLESEQRMRQFLADASHELRTPLTSIRGYAELARMQRTANGVPASADNLDRIESEGTRMSRLVDDLLLLARSDAENAVVAMHPEPVDIADLLDDAVSGSRAAFPERPIDLEVAPVPAVLGDRDQLVRMVRNLITNAAVHTEAGRPIRVHGFTDAGGAVITVADGGPGLPPEQAAHVFERFWRADKARSRARGGSGLGLAIVASVVAAHGGTVSFDSSVDAGSTVIVRLPVGSE
jgi:two-component system, OmpR family, sensor kinase